LERGISWRESTKKRNTARFSDRKEHKEASKKSREKGELGQVKHILLAVRLRASLVAYD
jgi:hypothetical protein